MEAVPCSQAARFLKVAMPPASPSLSIDRAEIERVYAAIRQHIRRTPVIEVDPADFLEAPMPEGLRLTFKLEFMQHTGSFKARGAFNHMLSREVPAAGIVAASGGNHGAAAAFAAMRTGHKATIFVPSIASPAKIARIESYGADLRVGGDRYADALAASERFIEETGALAVHAYDQDETLAGQGSVALEFIDQAAPDTMLVAVGGGGLIGGMAAFCRGETALVAVEPETAPTLNHALKAGAPVDAPAGGIAADSLAPRQIGARMFSYAQAFIGHSVLVPDAMIEAAQKLLWDRLRLVTEPGGAAALAALLSQAYRPAAGEHVGVLLCGANSTAVDFSRRG